ncbi:MAG: hypothetical protein HYZ65_14635 [Burkholderiales bacterium]|nr:hypothetical protein [Burkholderiales bacterium]
MLLRGARCRLRCSLYIRTAVLLNANPNRSLRLFSLAIFLVKQKSRVAYHAFRMAPHRLSISENSSLKTPICAYLYGKQALPRRFCMVVKIAWTTILSKNILRQLHLYQVILKEKS